MILPDRLGPSRGSKCINSDGSTGLQGCSALQCIKGCHDEYKFKGDSWALCQYNTSIYALNEVAEKDARVKQIILSDFVGKAVLIAFVGPTVIQYRSNRHLMYSGSGML